MPGPTRRCAACSAFKRLEADTKSLRDAVQANNAILGDLRVQLEQSRSQRCANGLIYALLALTLALALAGLAAVLAWRRGCFGWRPVLNGGGRALPTMRLPSNSIASRQRESRQEAAP